MELRKTLIVLVLATLSLSGVIAYTASASVGPAHEPASPAPADGRARNVLVESLRFPGAILLGAHRGQLPAALYALVAYGRHHTTALAYVFAFVGVAELQNRSVVAVASARNMTWAHTDFKIIRYKGHPIGLAMAFRTRGPIYINYTDPAYGESGYYDVNITVVLTALYNPRGGEAIMAIYGTGGLANRSLVAYDVHGGIVLLAGFKIEGWPGEDGHLAVGFLVFLRARAWLHTEEGHRTSSRVVWVSPFCGSSRPKLMTRSGLVRGVFAFINRAILMGQEGRHLARAACLYVIRGWLLRLAVIVPKADVVAYPALRR